MEYPKTSFFFLPAAANILLTLNGDVKVDDYALLIMIQIRLPILDKAVDTLWYLNDHVYIIILIDIWHYLYLYRSLTLVYLPSWQEQCLSAR